MRDAYLNFAATNGAADVWLTCGDNDQTDGSQANYTVSVFGGTYGYSNVMQNLPVRPAPGNHDYANASSTGPFYYANFDMPMNGEAGGVPSGSENYYSYDYANIHFISLDAITASLFEFDQQRHDPMAAPGPGQQHPALDHRLLARPALQPGHPRLGQHHGHLVVDDPDAGERGADPGGLRRGSGARRPLPPA